MNIKPAKGPVRWWLKLTGFAGITLPPFGVYILAERLTDVDLIRHERVHWTQYQRMGATKFYLTYLWQMLRYGYWNSPMEREARGE
jgi:hypothetical protein